MHLKRKYNICDQCESIQRKDPTNQNKLNQEVPLFDWWKVIALLALRQAEHVGSDLFGKVGRPNLEII
jgi:hypothetical protein